MTSARVLNDKPVWERDGDAWPNRETSRFVEAGGLRWHVQIAGSGPVALLAHGTAASTHSWRGLLPLLAEHFTVVAPDLPGHGFTGTPPPAELCLPCMASRLGALMRRLGLSPELAIGHSAGAAILARMCLDGLIAPQRLISLNGALLPLRGLPGKWFSPAAKLMARNSFLPRFVANGAKKDPKGVRRLADGTGSRLDAEGVALYRRLIASPGHLAAALNMMANWDLQPLRHDLPQLDAELVLVAFTGDKTVPPEEAERVHALMPRARLRIIRGFGHLAHEEAPEFVARLILDCVAPAPTPATG
ncbi:alpha/beta fold hydrolase [Thiohalocapsa marina]|uniref:Alpha/beta fold hydrolase n=1 Tax=Thiohalocapsa marina TaxID=424902 RepID=A0A5M8FQB7_9GAMM|nr:alpha/beta fold hydrolase BchO [Thiohalocapsa marina]KAA6185381.1 alpha/beta fold hydrolase [Thiohalocapsa marina]